MERLAVREGAIEKLENILGQFQSGRSLSKSRRRHIKKLQLIAFVSDNLTAIKDALIGRNIQVKEAEFEADVFIAKQDNCIVVSADGDYYFHKNIETYGKFIKKGPNISILAFKRSHILDKLELSSDQLLSLGILSGNDYADNIHSVGISSVFKWILGNTDSTETTQDLVESFASRYKVEPTNFDNAVRVFEALTETGLDSQQQDELRNRVDDMNRRYQIFAGGLDNATIPKESRTKNRTNEELTLLKLPKEKVRFTKPLLLLRPRYSYRTVTPVKRDKKSFVSVNRYTLLDESIQADTVEIGDENDVTENEKVESDSAEVTMEDSEGDQLDDSDKEVGSTIAEKPSVKGKEITSPSKPKKKLKGLHGSAQKSACDTESTADTFKRKKAKHTDFTKYIKLMDTKHPVETWLIGTIKSKLKHTDIGTDTEFRTHILDIIKGQCSSMNELIRLGQKATNYIIERIMTQEPQFRPLLNDLVGMVKNDGGNLFWSNLLIFLNNCKAEKKGEVRILNIPNHGLGTERTQ